MRHVGEPKFGSGVESYLAVGMLSLLNVYLHNKDLENN